MPSHNPILVCSNIIQKGSVETARTRVAFDRKIATKLNEWRQEGDIHPARNLRSSQEKIKPSEKKFINKNDGLVR